MSSDRLKAEIESLIDQYGVHDVKSTISKVGNGSEKGHTVLTIVANKGVHYLPEEFQRGEVYWASEGSLDFSSEEAIYGEIRKLLHGLAQKLKSKQWTKIYLVPFGHTNISLLIKLLVYRVTHIETIDIFHVGNGKYCEIDLSLREIVLKIENR